MSDLPDLKRRLRAAHDQIQSAPETGPGVYGAPDPKTGERWNAGNVLGHAAEMMPFWVDQVRGVLAGRKELGRIRNAGPRSPRSQPGSRDRFPSSARATRWARGGFNRPWLRSQLTQSRVQLEGSFSFCRTPKSWSPVA